MASASSTRRTVRRRSCMQGSPFMRAGSVVIRSSFSICFSPLLDRRQRVCERLSARCAVSLKIPELGLESLDFENRGNYVLLFSIICQLRTCPKILSAAVPRIRVDYSNLAFGAGYTTPRLRTHVPVQAPSPFALPIQL